MSAALIAIALVGGACSPTGSSGDGDDSPAVAYAACMRQNGVDDYPDPVDIDGELTSRLPEDFDLESSEFKAAEDACNPAQSGGEAPNPEDQQQQAEELEAALEFAACMREQGIDFPDPVIEEDGFSGPAGPLDNDVEGFEEASKVCEDKIDATTTP